MGGEIRDNSGVVGSGEDDFFCLQPSPREIEKMASGGPASSSSSQPVATIFAGKSVVGTVCRPVRVVTSASRSYLQT